MVLEGVFLNSTIVLSIKARFYQFPNGLPNIQFEAQNVHGGHMDDTERTWRAHG